MKKIFQTTLTHYLELKKRSWAPSTFRTRHSQIKIFLSFLEKHYPKVESFERLRRRPHIEAWLRYLAEDRQLTEQTRWASIFTVRRFLETLREWEWRSVPVWGLFLPEDVPGAVLESKKKSAVTKGCLRAPFQTILENYIDLARTRERPATAEHRERHIRSLLEFVEREYPEVESLDKIQRSPHVESWLQFLAQRDPPIKNNSRRKYIRHARRFFWDLYNWGRFPRPGSELIFADDFPTKDFYLPRPLQKDDDSRLLIALRKQTDPDRLAILLARLTGLRGGELVRLSVACLSKNNNRYSLHVPLGKLHSERVIPVDAEAARIVERLRRFRGNRPAGLRSNDETIGAISSVRQFGPPCKSRTVEPGSQARGGLCGHFRERSSSSAKAHLRNGVASSGCKSSRCNETSRSPHLEDDAAIRARHERGSRQSLHGRCGQSTQEVLRPQDPRRSRELEARGRPGQDRILAGPNRGQRSTLPFRTSRTNNKEEARSTRRATPKNRT